MALDWITPENVIRIARHLTTIDELSIKKEYQFELDSWICNLRDVMTQYLLCEHNMKANKSVDLSSTVLTEHYLSSLLKYAQAFVALLTSNAKGELRTIALG